MSARDTAAAAGENAAPDASTVIDGTIAAPPETTPGTALVKVSAAEIDALLAPATIDMKTWLTAIVGTGAMPDVETEETTLGMLAQIIGADTPAAVLSAMALERARELCGDEPGGQSPVMEFLSVRPMKSDYEEGANSYVIVRAVICESGETIQFTTGAVAVQMVLWKMQHEGWMPFKGKLEIKKEKTKKGYYPLNLVGGI
jgi:hypothetical protein